MPRLRWPEGFCLRCCNSEKCLRSPSCRYHALHVAVVWNAHVVRSSRKPLWARSVGTKEHGCASGFAYLHAGAASGQAGRLIFLLILPGIVFVLACKVNKQVSAWSDVILFVLRIHGRASSILQKVATYFFVPSVCGTSTAVNKK